MIFLCSLACSTQINFSKSPPPFYTAREAEKEKIYHCIHNFVNHCISVMIFATFFFYLQLFFVALSSFLLCRHLMMWKIFAPKFVFEGIIFIVSNLPSSVTAFMLLSRIENRMRPLTTADKFSRDDL